MVPLRQVSNVTTEGKDKAMTEYNAQKKHLLKMCPIRELSDRACSSGKRLLKVCPIRELSDSACSSGKSLSHPVDIYGAERSSVAFRI